MDFCKNLFYHFDFYCYWNFIFSIVFAVACQGIKRNPLDTVKYKYVVGVETEVHKHNSSKHRNSKMEEPQAQFAGHNTVNYIIY